MIEKFFEIAFEFWSVVGEMAPYLLFGFFVAGVLSIFISPKFVQRHMGGAGIIPTIKAAGMGIPLPLCSCGVIPVAATLRRHGAGKGPTTAFLIATPQDGVDSILVTFSLLGWVFAIFRPLVALVSSVVGGMAVSVFDRETVAERHELDRQEREMRTSREHNRFLEAIKYGFVILAGDIARPLTVGLIIAALISALVPQEPIAAVLGGDVWAMLIMMALGVPIYVCATASIPIAAALISKGASPGAALVFLMTGPATNAATIAVIWKTVSKKSAVIYVTTVAVCALAAGMLLDSIFGVLDFAPEPAMAAMIPAWVKNAAAVVLLTVIVNGLVRGKPTITDSRRQTNQDADKIEMKINGMTCSHCARTVHEALSECAGVRSVSVNLKDARASVTGRDMDAEDLKKAVESVGYGAEEISL